MRREQEPASFVTHGAQRVAELQRGAREREVERIAPGIGPVDMHCYLGELQMFDFEKSLEKKKQERATKDKKSQEAARVRSETTGRLMQQFEQFCNKYDTNVSLSRKEDVITAHKAKGGIITITTLDYGAFRVRSTGVVAPGGRAELPTDDVDEDDLTDFLVDWAT